MLVMRLPSPREPGPGCRPGFERARAIARAELDLARVRRAKVALIERASAFGVAAATMPSQEPHRSAEAMRRVLPELRKLERYERRAAARPGRKVDDVSYRCGKCGGNETRSSTTDPEAKLVKKGKGKEAKLAYTGNVMTENRNGFVVEAELRRCRARSSAKPRKT